MDARDYDHAGTCLAHDSVVEWPDSHERMTRDQWIPVNAEYPGDWAAVMEQAVATDTVVVGVTRVFARTSSGPVLYRGVVLPVPGGGDGWADGVLERRGAGRAAVGGSGGPGGCPQPIDLLPTTATAGLSAPCVAPRRGEGGVHVWDRTAQSRYVTVRDRLAREGVWQALARFHPVMAGSIPLGLDTEATDVDVLVEAGNLKAFRQQCTYTWGGRPGFSLAEREWQGSPAVICRFPADSRLCEVFAQPRPVAEQQGFRHLIAEWRLLTAGGEALYHAVRAARMRGLKTEPAFAEVLRLEGDPYVALLLDRCSDDTLQDIVVRRHASPR